MEQTPINITPVELEIKKSRAFYVQRWRKNNREKFNASVGRQNYNIRLQVLKHYGGDYPQCKFCRISNPDCLTVGGKKNIAWMKELRRKKYPEGLEIVCLNCNQIEIL